MIFSVMPVYSSSLSMDINSKSYFDLLRYIKTENISLVCYDIVI